MENLNVFKEKVTELYHSLVGFNLIKSSNKSGFANNQLYEIACNAVSGEDEYFIKWLTKNQGILGHKGGLTTTDNKPSPSVRLNVLLMKEVLIYGDISVEVRGYDKQPISMVVKQFMKDEDWMFEDSSFTYLLDKVVNLIQSGQAGSPFLKLICSNDKKALTALDVFCRDYYRCLGYPLHPKFISEFSSLLSDEEKKKKSVLIEHLFLDVKYVGLEKRLEEIKRELRGFKGSEQECKDLLKEYKEIKNKQEEIDYKIRRASDMDV